jgi:hypothetical protein
MILNIFFFFPHLAPSAKGDLFYIVGIGDFNLSIFGGEIKKKKVGDIIGIDDFGEYLSIVTFFFFTINNCL